MCWKGEDQVVVEDDAERRGGLGKAPSRFDVGRARLGDAARMVMGDDEAGGIVIERGVENGADRQRDRIRTRAAPVDRDLAAAGIEVEHRQRLARAIGEQGREPVGGGAGGDDRHRATLEWNPGRGKVIGSGMQPYLDLLRRILDEGVPQADRTGVGTRTVFGHQLRFDLAEGFPLLTTKKLHLRSILIELLWFLRGDTNVRWLHEQKVSIWDEWADEAGDLGPVYGKQWRRWQAPDGREIDQIAGLIDLIRRDPASRRQIVSAWNPADLHLMALAPCHCLFQTQVAAGRLNLQLYQRSADVFLGVPFNIASYALLTHMLAQQCGLEPGVFVWTGGDCHLYKNHLDQAREQLTREPRPLAKLTLLRRPADIGGYRYEDFEISGYDPHPHIKAEVAV